MVAERDDLAVLGGLGQVGVGVDQVMGAGVLGEEGQHRPGALRARGHVVLFQGRVMAPVHDGVEVQVEDRLPGGGQAGRDHLLVQGGQEPQLVVMREPVGLARWSAAAGCRCRGPWGRDVAAAVAVARHLDTGCAGEHDPVAGEPPPLVAEATAEVFHPETVLALVLAAYPAHQPQPGEAVDGAEHRFGHPVPEVVRPTRQGPVQAADQLVEILVAG